MFIYIMVFDFFMKKKKVSCNKLAANINKRILVIF